MTRSGRAVVTSGLMAALLIADEHHKLANRPAGAGDKVHLRAEQSEKAVADALESASKKLEDIAARLAHA